MSEAPRTAAPADGEPSDSDLLLPDLAAIRAAAERIAPHVRVTPVLTSRTLDERAGARLFFKCESFQRGGSFKLRGAANAVLALGPAAERGVVTHSSGNHGAAVALAAAIRGVRAWVVMPRDAPRVKREAVAGYGAEVVLCEPTAAARAATAERVRGETGAALVHPYDDPQVIAGQATVALELLAEVPELDAVLVPVGGGGLASGVAIALAALAPRVQVVGVEPAAADDAARSLAAGHRLANAGGPLDTLADGLKASLAERTFRALSTHLDSVVTVGEGAIVDALRLVWERMKIVIEPSSAVPVAALLTGAYSPPARPDGRPARIAIVLTGGNVDLDRLPWGSG